MPYSAASLHWLKCADDATVQASEAEGDAITDGRALEALDLLRSRWQSIRPSSDTLPIINTGNPSEVANLICAIALSGDFSVWGSAIPVYHALGAFLHFLGVERLADLGNEHLGEVSQAVWVCLRAVPERKVSECVGLILNTMSVADDLDDDFGLVRTLDNDDVRKVVERITKEPVAAHLIIQVLGADGVRPMPSGGSAGLLTRVGALDSCDSPFAGGRPLLRLEAMQFLESAPPELFLACEWWGMTGCPEACPLCAASTYCRALCSGEI